MSELELKLRVIKAEERIEEHKKRFFGIRREMDNEETLLVEAREAKRRAEDELYEYNRTKVGEFSLDDEREKQVKDYKSRMNASLASIADEKPIPYRTISDLGTIEMWPVAKD